MVCSTSANHFFFRHAVVFCYSIFQQPLQQPLQLNLNVKVKQFRAETAKLPEIVSRLSSIALKSTQESDLLRVSLGCLW